MELHPVTSLPSLRPPLLFPGNPTPVPWSQGGGTQDFLLAGDLDVSRRGLLQHQQQVSTASSQQQPCSLLTPPVEPRFTDPLVEPYCPDLSSILDDSYWDFPDVSQDASRDALRTPVPEWVDAMGLAPGLLPTPNSTLCMEGVQQFCWDRTQPNLYEQTPIHQPQPVSSAACMTAANPIDSTATWSMDFSLRVGCSPQGSVTSRRVHVQRDIATVSRTDFLVPSAVPRLSTTVAQGTESTWPEYQARQGTSSSMGYAAASTSSPQCPLRDPVYVRVGNCAVPSPSVQRHVEEGNGTFPPASPESHVASHPVQATRRPALLPTPYRLYLTNGPVTVEQAWDLRQPPSRPQRTVGRRTARQSMQSPRVTAHPYQSLPPVSNGTPGPLVAEESLSPGTAEPTAVTTTSTGLLANDCTGQLLCGGIGISALQEKRRPVESRSYAAAQYCMLSLRIGSFAVRCLEDRPASRLGGKFRIVFSRRRFIYEFEACSSMSEGQMRTCCVIVPFQAVVALRCDDDIVTLQVQSRPIIFFGRKAQRKSETNLDATRLIRAAYLEYYPIHQVQLLPHEACQVRRKLWEYSPRFHELMLRQICGPDTRLESPLPPYNPAVRWASIKPRAQKTQEEVQSKHPAAVSTRLLLARSGGSTTSEPRCCCRVSCRSATSCPCARARLPCDLQDCSCTACDNPMNLLQKLGVDLQDARSDACLMHSIYEIRDLSWYLWQHVHLSCSSEGALVRECLPGRKPCPRCGAPSQFSWCTNALFHDTMVYHCPICERCNFQTGTHCPKCNLCYVFGNLGKKCPRCGIFEPAASEVTLTEALQLPQGVQTNVT